MVDYDDWPRPSGEELPDMYEDTERMVDTVEPLLEEHFEVRESGSEKVVVFSEADAEDYLAAMDADHHDMVAFFQKVVGLPDREFERQYDISGLGQRLRKRKSTLRGYEPAEAFAEALEDLMPESLHMETVLYTFFKMWEKDQRRFYRMRYESKVQEFLREHGYPNFKGNSLPGEPDIVVPEEEPYEVIGEVRVIQQKDREKRFKEFRSEAEDASTNFPNSYFIAVAHMGAYLQNADREYLRSKITKDNDSEIDAVFFHDERDDMLDQFEEWGVSRVKGED